MAVTAFSKQAGWYGAGPELFWGIPNRTYAFVPSEALPRLPERELDASLSWLPSLPPRSSPVHYRDQDGGLAEGIVRLEQIKTDAADLGLSIPEVFIQFMSTPDIHRRVPSITACYLDPSHGLLEQPIPPGGRLLRFLTDSQECVSWFLCLSQAGDNPVLAALDLHDDARGELAPDDDAIRVVSSTFEQFLHRFWLENLLWLKVRRREPLAPEETEYLAAASLSRPLVVAQNPPDD